MGTSHHTIRSSKVEDFMYVECYWNLHKQLYSVRHQGRVVAHLPFLTLKNVKWVVQPAGRRRVLQQNKKNVHAFARGTWLYGDDELQLVRDELLLTERQPIMYDPYKHTQFVLRSNPDTPINKSDYAKLCSAYDITTDTYSPAPYVYSFKTQSQTRN